MYQSCLYLLLISVYLRLRRQNTNAMAKMKYHFRFTNLRSILHKSGPIGLRAASAAARLAVSDLKSQESCGVGLLTTSGCL